MELRLERPIGDATSGLYAVNAKAIPLLAEPYSSGAPEVEGLIRIVEAACGSTKSPWTCVSAQAESRSSAGWSPSSWS
jgi:hypothetical protein